MPTDFVPTLSNAAVFFKGSRRFKNIDVLITPTTVSVHNRVNGQMMAEWTITDTAKAGEAWDATEMATGQEGRLVAQLGCGCSGMKKYDEDQEYKDRHSA